MNRGSKLIRGSTINVIALLLSVTISFFMMPYLIKTLGDRMYGLWVLVGAFIGYYGLLDLGLSSAVGRFVSRAVGNDDKEEIRKVVCTSFYLFSIIGIFRIGVAYKIEPAISINLKYFEKNRIKELFDYSIYTFIGRLADMLRFNVEQEEAFGYTRQDLEKRLIDWQYSIFRIDEFPLRPYLPESNEKRFFNVLAVPPGRLGDLRKKGVI